MKSSPTHKPPKILSAEARALWTEIMADFAIDDRPGRLLLAGGLEAFDRMRQAQRVLKRDGLTIKDRWGQLKAHPCVFIERDSRTAVLATFRALRLDPGALGDAGRSS